MILVNHKRRYTSFNLRAGDEVIFISGEEKKNDFLKPSNNPVSIVLENKNYLVVNKPAGCCQFPHAMKMMMRVVNRLLGYFAQKGQKNLKPHVITRLDRDTSGLVLVGKKCNCPCSF